MYHKLSSKDRVLDVAQYQDFATFQPALYAARDETPVISSFDQKLSFLIRLRLGLVSRGQREERLASFLKEALSALVDDRERFENLFQRAARELLSAWGIRARTFLTAQAVRRLFEALSSLSFGGSFPLFAKSEFQKGEDAKNILRWFMGTPSFRDCSFRVMTFRILKAFLFKKESALMQEICSEIETLGTALCQRLQKNHGNPWKERLSEILLGHLLTLLPFFEPEQGQELKIPQKIQGCWEMISCCVERLSLTPRWLGAPFLAFALKPKQGSPKGARLLLLFPGTAQPTASWAPLDLWTDFAPLFSIGEFLFSLFAKKRLSSFLQQERAASRHEIEVSGISLGGSLTLLTVAHFPDLVQTARAYTPAALGRHVMCCYEKKSALLKTPPDVSLFVQKGDIVSWFGARWARAWRLFLLVPEKPLGRIASHLKAFSSLSCVALIPLDPERESRRLRRKVFRALFFLFSLPVFIILSFFILMRSLIASLRAALVFFHSRGSS